MDGVFYLLGVLAIAVIVQWAVRNDKAGPDGTTSGLLAMRDQAPAATATAATAATAAPPRPQKGWRDALTAPPGRRR